MGAYTLGATLARFFLVAAGNTLLWWPSTYSCSRIRRQYTRFQEVDSRLTILSMPSIYFLARVSTFGLPMATVSEDLEDYGIVFHSVVCLHTHGLQKRWNLARTGRSSSNLSMRGHLAVCCKTAKTLDGVHSRRSMNSESKATSKACKHPTDWNNAAKFLHLNPDSISDQPVTIIPGLKYPLWQYQ